MDLQIKYFCDILCVPNGFLSLFVAIRNIRAQYN